MSWNRRKVVTDGEYTEIQNVYQGRCAVCGAVGRKRRLHLDHDHRSGRIRGILCHRHNRGIQFFGDNPEYLRRAAEYLETGLFGRVGRAVDE